MTSNEIINNLAVPIGKIDVVIDSDAYNEIDDQFAISYLLRSKEKLNTVAIYAAPFFNPHSNGPEDGMLKSYNEIKKLLSLLDEEREVYKGSKRYLIDENTPVVSPAAEDLARRAMTYSPKNPLYVVAIGAITNVASAILLNPEIKDNIVVVWLGGHALHYHDAKEFNLKQDVAAARVVINSKVPFVQLPCNGVVSSFTVSKYDLEKWLLGKSVIADYLAKNAIREVEEFEGICDVPWSRCIWDVTAVAWLLNDNNRFMLSRIVPAHLPTYDNFYTLNPNGHPISYVYFIKRDELLADLFKKLSK
ncbi:MAG: nucleoside hydrolase [Clostridia bacterium]|nr:nucleoside hydrolase [Clostridia bacterium]